MSSIILKESDEISSATHNPAEQAKSYEVFRNNTTAVEVVVKDVAKSKKKTLNFHDMKMIRIQKDIDNLHSELDNANKHLRLTRKGFYAVVGELREQIEAITSREADTQAENVVLKLDNEKMRILLESKTKLLCRLKKELSGLKRVLKTVVKSICNAPEIPGSYELCSDTEYEDFESDLRSITPLKNLKAANKIDPYNSTFSVKDHCVKKL